jgi:type I restriction enzyme M protein
MLSKELKSKVEKMCNYLWSAGITNPMDYIEQISYFFFLKMLEERDNAQVEIYKKSKKKYKSIFENKDELRWSHWIHKSGQELHDFVRNKVFPFIAELHNGNADAAQFFGEARLIIDDPVVLKNLIGVIEQIDFSELDPDTKGDFYEYLLSQISTSGRNGQFRTPRHIIRMIVSLVDPKIGETVCDPACGTAGFLIGAYNHIKLKNSFKDSIDEANGAKRGPGDKLTTEEWDFLENHTFFGSDVDRRMIRLAMMNLLLHGLGKVNVHKRDAIAIEYQEEDTQCDIVLANPPFAGTIDKERIKKSLPVLSKKTEILFLGHFIDSLKDKGRAGIVVPEGLLFGNSSGHREIRRILLDKCNLEGVVSLPSGCFQPYSGVKTSVLFFTKGKKTEKVWFYEVTADGYSLDIKRNPTVENDIPDLISKWAKKEADNEKCWVASIEEIQKHDYNLSASRYKPHKVEEVEYADPNELIEEVIEIEAEIGEELRNLQNGLKKGLKDRLKKGLKNGL